MAEQTPEQVIAAETAAKAASEAATKSMVEGAVRSTIESLVKEGQARQAEVDAAKVAEAETAKAGAHPFADMVGPALEPAMKTARDAEAQARNATDAVAFYTDPTAGGLLKYRARIEQVVAEQAKRGNVISRKDAWNWLRGGELYDELSKESLALHEAKVKEAQAAATVGGGIQVPKFSKPVEQLNTDELGEALKGVAF